MTTRFDIIRLKAQVALGNTEAMCELGYNYLYGIGIEPDFEKAHEYLEKAASKDFKAAKVLICSVFADNGEFQGEA